MPHGPAVYRSTIIFPPALQPVATLFLCVLGLLLCATASGLLLRLLRPQWRLQDFFKRLTSWWIVTAVMLVVTSTPPLAGTLLFGFVILLALKECWQALWPAQRGLLALALAWLAFSLAHLLLLLRSGDAQSLLLFCWIILLTQLNDIAQYFAGKALGKQRIVPRISPNKTREGLLGGVLFSCLVSAAVTPLLLPLSLLQSLLFGLLLGLAGFAGDILFSWIKRSAGIKDFGNLLPGQGGILDRLDSVTCTAPLLYYYTLFLTHL